MQPGFKSDQRQLYNLQSNLDTAHGKEKFGECKKESQYANLNCHLAYVNIQFETANNHITKKKLST